MWCAGYFQKKISPQQNSSVAGHVTFYQRRHLQRHVCSWSFLLGYMYVNDHPLIVLPIFLTPRNPATDQITTSSGIHWSSNLNKPWETYVLDASTFACCATRELSRWIWHLFARTWVWNQPKLLLHTSYLTSPASIALPSSLEVKRLFDSVEYSWEMICHY